MATTGEDETTGAGREGAPDHLSLLKALAHPVRLHLLGELSYRNISPAEFARERDEPIPNVSYHFRALEKLGCIEVVETKPAGGSIEHFYRRTAAVVYDDEYWLQMPDDARRIVASTTIEGLFGRMSQAIQAGTFTARHDAHLTWTPLPLDEQGWTEVMEILDSTFKKVAKAETQASKRLAESGEPGLIATVALAGFESPPEPT